MPAIRSIRVPLILLMPLCAAQIATAEDSGTRTAQSIGYIVGPTNYDANESADEGIQRLFSLYMDARSAGMMQEADILAKQIVEQSILSFGRNSKDTARALTSLATLQTTNHENIAAIQNFTAAIDIVHTMDGRLSMDLINPLKAMGAAQLQEGNGDLARDAWVRAIHITHVNLGPHNIEQIETLQAIANLYSGAEETKESRRVLRRIEYLKYRYSTLPPQGIKPEVFDDFAGAIPVERMGPGFE